jgi:hypothetical protein
MISRGLNPSPHHLEALKTLQNLIVLQRFCLGEQNLNKRTKDPQRETVGAKGPLRSPHSDFTENSVEEGR